MQSLSGETQPVVYMEFIEALYRLSRDADAHRHTILFKWYNNRREVFWTIPNIVGLHTL